jgi:threonyl-tRNA synthetase
MAQISITVDGVVHQVEADQRPTHIFAESKDVVVCRVNGVLKDLWTELAEGDVVESVLISSPDGLAVLRHSTAHVHGASCARGLCKYPPWNRTSN